MMMGLMPYPGPSLNDELAREQALMRRHRFGLRAMGAEVRSTPGSGAFAAGTLSAERISGGALLRTASAAAPSAYAAIRTSHDWMFCDDRPFVLMRFRAPHVASANAVTIVGLHNGTGNHYPTGMPTLRGIILRCANDATWRLVTSDGTTATALDTGVAVSTNQWAMLIDYKTAGVARVKLWEYVTSAWVYRGETLGVGTLPTGGSTSTDHRLCAIAMASTIDGTAYDVCLGHVDGFADECALGLAL